jgi:uncharacterized membrane protein
MGENNFASLPVALYGCVLFFSAIAYFILTLTLISHHGKDSSIAVALGKDFKGKISVVIYAVGIILSFEFSLIACLLYVLVAIMWLIPDKRIEKILSE